MSTKGQPNNWVQATPGFALSVYSGTIGPARLTQSVSRHHAP